MMGAFQGANDATTPAGCRIDIEIAPGEDVDSTSPTGWVTDAAASRSISAARCTLKAPHGPTAPVSAVTSEAASLERDSSRAAASRNNLRLTVGAMAAHGPKAASAASTARFASSGPAAATVVTISPV